MTFPSGTPSVLRRLNERSILGVLLEHGAASRLELQQRTGLSLPTVTRAVGNLQRLGLVAATGRQVGARGPAAALYAVRPDGGGLAAAVTVTGEEICASVLDPAGHRLALASARTLRRWTPEQLTGAVLGLHAEAMAAAGVGREHLGWATLAVPAIVDGAGLLGKALSPALDGLTQDAMEALRRGIGARGDSVENDANLAALAEHQVGAARGVDDVIYLSLARDVGVGVLLGGRLHRGATGAAGEISHLPVGPVDPFSAAARRHGALALGLRRQAGDRRRRSVAAAFAAAARGDEGAAQDCRRYCEQVALAVAAMAAVLDPALVVVDGFGAAAGDLALTLLRTALARVLPAALPVEAAELGRRAVLRGAELVAVGQLHAALHARVGLDDPVVRPSTGNKEVR